MAIAQRAGAANAFGAVATGNLTGFNCQTNDVIEVSISIPKNNTVVSTITDTIGNTYAPANSLSANNGTSQHIEKWWVPSSIGSSTTNVITINLVAASKFVGSAESYSAVLGGIGNTATNTGSSTAPAVTLTTQDANNWIAAAIGSNGVGTLSASAPNVMRQTAVTSGGGGTTNSAGGEGDAGAFASAGSHTDTFTISASEPWATAGIELRSVALLQGVDDPLPLIRFQTTPYSYG